MDFEPPFGPWLKARRRQLDLTQAALAQRAHYSTIAIQKVEAGQPVSRALAAALAAALDFPETDRPAFVNFARGLEIHQPLNHLPLPATAMLGREADLTALAALLAPVGSERLVTLLGPPGVGKTRLALQLARQLQPVFPDGAAFVLLAPLADAAHIPGAILNTLHQRAPGSAPSPGGLPPIESLTEFLESRASLLVLDNFEHLIDGAPVIGQLLARCPRLRVLVTSRERLNLSGERLVELRPLARPDAIALFVRQAAAVKPGFARTPQNEATLDAICAHLDDLPLAIELAAARARMLTPTRLLARLTDHAGSRFSLLNAGPRDADPRQRALSSTIDWSYRLLTEAEQRFFRRLSVFAGGCDLAGAAAVCLDSINGDAPDMDGAEQALQSLLDKSLIYETEGLDGSVRSNQLEMIREYALLQLAQSGEVDETFRRLAIHLNNLGEASQPYVPKSNNIGWIKRLGSERDNIAVALEWCRMPGGDHTLGLLLTGRLGWVISWGAFYGFVMPLTGTEVWYENIEERIAALPEHLQAATLYGLMDLVHATGEWERARVVNDLTRDIAQRTGDWRTEANTLFTDCIQHDYVEGNYARAEPFYLRMVELTRRDTLRHAVSLGMLGRALVAYRQPERAIPILKEALDAWDGSGIAWTMFGGWAFANECLANACMWLDRYDEALRYAIRAIEGNDTIQMPGNHAHYPAAMSALALGDWEEFARHMRVMLERRSVLEHRTLEQVKNAISTDREVACDDHAALYALRHQRDRLPASAWPGALALMANLRILLGDMPAGLRLYGAAYAHLKRDGDALGLRDLLAPKLDKIRSAALAREEHFSHWRAGEGMSLDDAAVLMEGVLERVDHRTDDRWLTTEAGTD